MHWLRELAEAIESADNEIGACGGERAEQHRLEGLLDEAMGRLGALESFLRDRDPEARTAALATVKWLKLAEKADYNLLNVHAKAVRRLLPTVQREVERLSDQDPVAEVRAAAVVALIELGGDELAPLLALRLADDDRTVQDLAIAWLSTARDPSVVRVLLARIDTEPSELLVNQLRAVGTAEAAPHFHRLLGSQSAEIRAAAVQSLVEFVDESHTPALIALLDGDGGTALRAAVALSRCPTPAAAPALRKLLSGPDSALKDAAARALAELGEPNLAAHLGPLAEPKPFSQPWPERRVATLALLGDPEALALSRRAFTDGEWYLRQIAALTIALYSTTPAEDIALFAGVFAAQNPVFQPYSRQVLALAILLLDFDARVDELDAALLQRYAPLPNGDWESDGLVCALAFEAFAQKLDGCALSPLGKQRLRTLIGISEIFADRIEAAIGQYRQALSAHAWVFPVQDRLTRARRVLLRLGQGS
jgi:HEAT repeat protein